MSPWCPHGLRASRSRYRHRINHYPADSVIDFRNTYPLDSDLSGPGCSTLDSVIHRIKIYPVDNAIGFPNTYPLDSDLSGG